MENVRAVFVDSNVLVFAAMIQSEHHERARSALLELSASGASFCISGQVLREVYSALTRQQPVDGYRAMTPIEAADVLDALRKDAVLLSEDAQVAAELQRLARLHSVSGKQIHDANIVATMLKAGVRDLLTANSADFQRYSADLRVTPL